MYLFFDTETTGLPRNWRAPVSDLRNWPRMVQLAWQVYNFSGELIDERNAIIRPEGYAIPASVSRLHGITDKRAREEGEDLSTILGLFASVVGEAQLVAAHNISFDLKIVGAEFLRTKIEHQLEQKPQVCTMKSSLAYLKLPGKYGKYKNPSLTELHQKLFGAAFDDAHNALADVAACARCFFELKKRSVIR